MHLTALVLNALVSLASAAWAAVALHRPGKLSGSEDPDFGEHYYAQLYAVRALPFGSLAAAAPAFVRGDLLTALLAAAAAVQAADALIGLRSGKRDMVTGASVAAVTHLGCAFALR